MLSDVYKRHSHLDLRQCANAHSMDQVEEYESTPSPQGESFQR